MFKNLQVYRLTDQWSFTRSSLNENLKKMAFVSCGSQEESSHGWVSPRNNDELVHAVGKQMLICLEKEKKLLPAKVINQVTQERAAEVEKAQGFKLGRKQMKELKEQVTDELLPRALSVHSRTSVWIDPVNKWLIVDASSPAKADEVFSILLKTLDGLPIAGLRVNQSAVSAMTEWLAADEAPHNFTVDQDTELRAQCQSKATVKYVRHTLDTEDVRGHIASGKQCTRLAMTWNDRISFVLTETLAIKRVTPLDVLRENSDEAQNEEERFDSDFALMTGELHNLLSDLVDALGGEEDTSRGEHGDANQEQQDTEPHYRKAA